jgi:multidrug efflux system outer membrane protein
MSRLIGGLCFLLILTGCIRPHYKPPPVNTPSEWRIEADEGSTLCNLRWWEQFNDPVLDELIVTALKHNQVLKAAISNVFIYYARLGIAKSALYPNLAGNAIYSRARSSLVTPATSLLGAPAPQNDLATSSVSSDPSLPSGITPILNDYQLFFSTSWELDFWGRVRSAVEAANYDLLSQIENRRSVVLSVVNSVATGYIRLRQLDSQLEISKKTLASRKESLQLAMTRFNLGETSELEVKQAESEVEDAAISVLEFEREIPIQENLLSVLIGQNPRDIERGNSLDTLHYLVDIPTGLPSDLLVRRPDIVGAEDALIAANARITEVRALFFPQISLTGMFGSESFELSSLLTGPAKMWQYGFNAMQNIFDAGRTVYRVYEAEAYRNQVLHNYYQTILNAFREVNDALVRYRKNRALFLEHQIQVKVLGDYLHLAQLRYQEGEVDYLNVLDAERALFNAQLSMIQAQADSFTAISSLYSALGGGWVTDADEIAMRNTYCN